MERERTRKPTTPGEILLEEFLKPANITQTELAEHIGCDVKTVNRLVQGHTSLDVKMARRLEASFGTSAEFWMDLQKAVDLYEFQKTDANLPPRLEQFKERPRT